MMLVKGMVVQIIEASDDRILFEEWTEGMPRNSARIFRVTPIVDEGPMRDYPNLAVDELRPKEVK